MRVTIIPSDEFVMVDGVGYTGLDLSFIPTGIHAIQWYGSEGEVEYADERGRAVKNEPITDLQAYSGAVAAWEVAHAARLLFLSEGDAGGVLLSEGDAGDTKASEGASI
jgi:hypothetical protein